MVHDELNVSDQIEEGMIDKHPYYSHYDLLCMRKSNLTFIHCLPILNNFQTPKRNAIFDFLEKTIGFNIYFHEKKSVLL